MDENGFLKSKGDQQQVTSKPPKWVEPNEDDDVIRIPRKHLYALLVPLAFIVGLASGYLAWGRNQLNEPATGGYTRFDVPLDDDPALGPEDAPIKIVEFSDFNCPYCQKWHEETFPALMGSYPDQIRFVYRDYPILTQESVNAAQAAECADEQGAFWAFHDALFSGGRDLGQDTYETYAQELGLDVEGLVACINSGRYEEEVTSDAEFASNLGISGTPTFFINGIPLVGAQPLERFAEIIDLELDAK
jgi:protein-disulfide isomerase